MSVYVFLNDTYADWELGYLLPELVSEDWKILTFGLDQSSVKSLGGLSVQPDVTFSDINIDDMQALILPGGHFWKEFENSQFDSLVLDVAKKNIPIGAICAATGYLARLGVLNNVKHTSNSVEFLKERAPSYSGQDNYTGEMATSDSGFVTAGGLGAVDFTYKVFHALSVGKPEDREIWYQAFKNGIEPTA